MPEGVCGTGGAWRVGQGIRPPRAQCDMGAGGNGIKFQTGESIAVWLKGVSNGDIEAADTTGRIIRTVGGQTRI